MSVTVLGKDDDAPHSIFITRGRSILGNPFVIGEHGTREEVIVKYEEHLDREMSDPSSDISVLIHDLANKSYNGNQINLRCVCKPKACHGDVIKNTIDNIVRNKTDNLITPETDGINHINVYSKGNTSLGRMLSNFYVRPFKYKKMEVQCIEGLWYYLATGEQYLELLTMNGNQAKRIGSKYPKRVSTTDLKGDFLFTMAKAIHVKVVTNPDIANALKSSTLPLMHYYVQADGKMVVPTGSTQWFLSVLNKERELLKTKASLQLDITED